MKGPKKKVRHRKREKFSGEFQPVMVTTRFLDDVCNLRNEIPYEGIKHILKIASIHLGMHILQFSVQGNHIHYVVESADSGDLSRAIQGLNVRIAKWLNRLMGRRGKVFADRFHSKVIRTLKHAYRALQYVV